MEYQNQYPARAAVGLAVEARSRFVMRTYGHLMGAIVAFVMLEVFLFQSGLAIAIAEALLGVSWLIVLGGFMVVSWLASRFAHTAQSMAVQYVALGAFVVAQSIIFVPLLFIANYYAPGTISSAALVTMIGFGGLTAVVFVTRKDFSFLRSAMIWGGVLALVARAATATVSRA